MVYPKLQQPINEDERHPWFRVSNSWSSSTKSKSGMILVMGAANERRRYNVTSFLIGWANTWNIPVNAYCISLSTCSCITYISVVQNSYISATPTNLFLGLLIFAGIRGLELFSRGFSGFAGLAVRQLFKINFDHLLMQLYPNTCCDVMCLLHSPAARLFVQQLTSLITVATPKLHILALPVESPE